MPDFRRARSAAAKQLRESAILEAARVLGAERGIRQITLTEIAEAVGMHKLALLRYFETREEIFLRLTADGWREWSAALRTELEGLAASAPVTRRRPSPGGVRPSARRPSLRPGSRPRSATRPGPAASWPARAGRPASPSPRR